MNKITAIRFNTGINTIYIKVFRQNRERTYYIDNTFANRVRVNILFGKIIRAKRVNLIDQSIQVNGWIETLYEPVYKPEYDPTSIISDLEDLGYDGSGVPVDVLKDIDRGTQDSSIAYWDALEGLASHYNVPRIKEDKA